MLNSTIVCKKKKTVNQNQDFWLVLHRRKTFKEKKLRDHFGSKIQQSRMLKRNKMAKRSWITRHLTVWDNPEIADKNDNCQDVSHASS